MRPRAPALGAPWQALPGRTRLSRATGVVGLVGVATPKLVVEDDRAPGVGKLLKGLKVVRRSSGTAMEHQQRELSRCWLGEVSNDTVPTAEPSKRDETFAKRRGRWHGVCSFAVLHLGHPHDAIR
jgi:hypothetical protein